MGADTDPVLLGGGERSATMTSGSPAWKPQATLAEVTILQHLGVVAHGPGAEALAHVAIEIDRVHRAPQSRSDSQYSLYGRNLPLRVSLTRSPFGSGWRSIAMSKSMALMMPSPNSSWISSFQVVP